MKLDELKYQPWKVRRLAAYVLYRQGYPTTEIGMMVGKKHDPNKPMSRNDVWTIVGRNGLSKLDSHLHSVRRRARQLRRWAEQLTPGEASKVLELAVYFEKESIHILPEDLDRIELRFLYDEGFRLSPIEMKASRYTGAMYKRLQRRYSGYRNALSEFGIPETVCKYSRK